MIQGAPKWFPDWSGQAVAIVASGPSAKSAGIEKLRGRIKVVAIKENVDLCPWADMVYGCDAAWWRNRLGLANYAGLKVSAAGILSSRYADIRIVKVETLADRPIFDPKGVLGAGGNSGFQVVNLLAQLGVKRQLLIGFDLHGRGGLHWYGRNNGTGRHNPTEDNFRRWQAAFAGSADEYRKRDIEIVNASPVSAIHCFPRRSVEKTLSGWGL